MRPIPVELRERVIMAYEADPTQTQEALGKRFLLSQGSVSNILAKHRKQESLEPDKPSGRPHKLSSSEHEFLKQLTKEKSDMTLAEQVLELEKQRGVKVGKSTLCRILQQLHLTRKKKTRHDPARDTDEHQAQREEFQEWLKHDQLVFLDESGIHTEMSRDYGRSPKGQRVHEAKRMRPKAENKLTLIAGLNLSGLLAPCELKGSLTGESFYAYVRDILIPELQPGQIVVLDNLSCHKVTGITDMLEKRGISCRYLPPYSPDFSPIEECWSKIKAYLKGCAERTIESLQKSLLKAFDRITLSDILGWFKHAGCVI